jgi:hypothetical protein
MEAPKKHCCHGDCDELMQERLNYFTGRHLAARDFKDEQLYHRSHRYLHNRMLHGWGVVCGLEVMEHAQDDCRNRYVKIGSGLAIDCCGREIVVERASCCGDEQPGIPWDKYEPERPWLMLCLSYLECGTEPVPVIHSEGDCSTEKTQPKYGRSRESWKLEWRWLAKSQLRKYGWGRLHRDCDPKDKNANQTPGQQGQITNPAQQPQYQAKDHETESPQPDTDKKATPPPEHPHIHELECLPDDCIEPCAEGYVDCVKPNCPPDHCVPLSIICVRPGEKITKDRIEMRGRPKLPYGPQRLTHIVDINWPHGRVVTPQWLKDNPLTVTFDRKVQPPSPNYYPGPWGINHATFVVQFGGHDEDLDFVPSDGPPVLTADGLRAEYQIAPRKHKPDGYGYLEGHTLWITIKGDFLYDCHGMRVDGNNNGVEGGTFESWVTVVDRYEYERLEKEGLL